MQEHFAEDFGDGFGILKSDPEETDSDLGEEIEEGSQGMPVVLDE